MAKTGSNRTKKRMELFIRLSDAQLISMAQAGEQNAFTCLFERYHNSLMTYIVKISQTQREVSEEPEDICIETFHRAFQNIGRYDSKYKFTTWIYRIAKNCITDSFRRSKNSINNSVSTDSDNKELSRIFSNDSPEDNLIGSQQIEKAMEAINCLPAIYKDVMLLYIEDYALDEIAAKLKISLSTVKVRVNRGKNQLAEVLKDNPLAQKRARKAKGVTKK